MHSSYLHHAKTEYHLIRLLQIDYDSDSNIKRFFNAVVRILIQIIFVSAYDSNSQGIKLFRCLDYGKLNQKQDLHVRLVSFLKPY